MSDRDRLAALLHDIHAGCLEDLPDDPVTPGDDARTHLKDADRLLAAGVTLAPSPRDFTMNETRTAWRCPACGHVGSVPGVLTFRAAPSPDLAALRDSIIPFGDLFDEAQELEEPSPEYDEWCRRAASALGLLVPIAFRAVDCAESAPPPAKPDAERLARARRAMVDGIGTDLSREFAQGNPFEPCDRIYVTKVITRVLDAARARIDVAAGIAAPTATEPGL